MKTRTCDHRQRGTANAADAANGADDLGTGVYHVCACGTTYTHAAWIQLSGPGVVEHVGLVTDLRHCTACGTTAGPVLAMLAPHDENREGDRVPMAASGVRRGGHWRAFGHGESGTRVADVLSGAVRG